MLVLLWWINSRWIAPGCKMCNGDAPKQRQQQLQPRCRHFCFWNFLRVVSRFSPPTQAANVSHWRTSLHLKSLCSQQHSSKQENQWLSAEHGNIYDFGDWICVAYCWPAAAKTICILQRNVVFFQHPKASLWRDAGSVWRVSISRYVWNRSTQQHDRDVTASGRDVTNLCRGTDRVSFNFRVTTLKELRPKTLRHSWTFNKVGREVWEQEWRYSEKPQKKTRIKKLRAVNDGCC